MADGMLHGVRVLELLGIGPEPFAGMLLADLGADVLALRRPGQVPGGGGLERGRPVVAVNLKDPEVLASVRGLVASADVLLEGYRPGVAERLGLGPQDCHAINPRLVYGRMTGWGQAGPLAPRAGHDINYIAVTGALHAAARAGQRPTPPANLLGDFGGGGMYLVTAVLAALLERARTGTGRVLDIAITDGTTYLASMLYGMHRDGQWRDEAGTNLLDTGAPYYDVYECADGRYVAIGALEPQFFAALAALLGLDAAVCADRDDPAHWPALRAAIAAAVLTRTRDEWAALAADTDACLAPVLDLSEAPRHGQAVARDLFIDGMPRLPIARAAAAGDIARTWGVDAALFEGAS
ncbi:CaiB/BaiF CoA transferase family protein [Dactylosporangium matsuzakiense]|uniref:CoA transferase n=1 Tax=Dactylosporangium matsuzakiense TaxID=53360 RepID=A0A9W6KCP2_9ACTN|nr:CaiB/BaiF CoA-transferase family protein [Dactylosporangium matsuzakiense]UWZ47104.1 CoA transferase [Dactylosporangium matsuzakiense]GLK98461.1 CoA transferase [Dactylosporangium matsuzakiense]